MGWSVDSERELDCPCKRGTFTVSYRSDDWSRSDEVWTMNCEACRLTYVLVTFTGLDQDAIPASAYGWVSTETCRDASRRRAQALRLREHGRAIVETLFAAWSDSLDRTTKKSIWRQLTANGARYPSLATFYQHLKYRELDSYIRTYFAQNFQELVPEGPSDRDRAAALLADAEQTFADVDRLILNAAFSPTLRRSLVKIDSTSWETPDSSRSPGKQDTGGAG